MNKSASSAFKTIKKDKKLIMSVIVIGLVVIFIFSIENGNPEGLIKESQAADFVIDESENIIEPIRELIPSVVLSPGNFDFNQVCSIYNMLPMTATTTDIKTKLTRVPVLMYHYIEDQGNSSLPYLFTNTDIFEAQLKTLKLNCYQTFFMRDLAQAIVGDQVMPAKSIVLTFDDGYADWYYNVLPLLKKYQIKATMYVIVDAIGKPGYLTKEQMKEMLNSGYVEFGSHTLTHVNLRDSSMAVARKEIINSKRELEKIIERPVYNLAYPYGFFTYRDESICQEAGYLTCASTWPSDVQSYDRRYYLYRLRQNYRVGNDFIDWLEKVDHSKLMY